MAEKSMVEKIKNIDVKRFIYKKTSCIFAFGKVSYNCSYKNSFTADDSSPLFFYVLPTSYGSYSIIYSANYLKYCEKNMTKVNNESAFFTSFSPYLRPTYSFNFGFILGSIL